MFHEAADYTIYADAFSLTYIKKFVYPNYTRRLTIHTFVVLLNQLTGELMSWQTCRESERLSIIKQIAREWMEFSSSSSSSSKIRFFKHIILLEEI